MSTICVIYLIGLAMYLMLSISVLRIMGRPTIGEYDKDFITKYLDDKKESIILYCGKNGFSLYENGLFFCPVIVSLAAVFLSGSYAAGIVFFFAGFFLPEAGFRLMKQKSRKGANEAFEDSLEKLSTSLTVGKNLLESMRDVASNEFVHPALRSLYRQAVREAELGVSLGDAFFHMAESLDNPDARQIAMAVRIHSVVGGDEAATVKMAFEKIHNRGKAYRDAKTQLNSSNITMKVFDVGPISITLLYLAIIDRNSLAFYFSSGETAVLLVILLCGMVGVSFVSHMLIRRTLRA